MLKWGAIIFNKIQGTQKRKPDEAVVGGDDTHMKNAGGRPKSLNAQQVKIPKKRGRPPGSKKFPPQKNNTVS